ncbi:hypothetical protein [Paenibacillus illinoisensis]|uniref:Uncharacterized protein n=1 Tax=Paenibacillus illinoisensis TaxID=59845 RepID=A0A2W0C884_9BACL|nr:hypothetical protein [Paenibacillus illinoisensis]PYY28214.1 hypothetical protein PIL02S_03360 [Paenibacillus illinoisensis]
MFTIKQLQELSYLAWWDLECSPINILREDWKTTNDLSEETIEQMMSILAG